MPIKHPALLKAENERLRAAIEEACAFVDRNCVNSDGLEMIGRLRTTLSQQAEQATTQDERKTFEVEIPDISAIYDGRSFIPYRSLEAGERLMTVAQHLRIEKQLRAALTRPAQTEQQPVARVAGNEIERYLRWEDGVAAFDLEIGAKLYAAPIAQTYPRRVTPHIDQFAEGVFVWYDEAALPGGAEPTLQAAQQAMAAYGESLNGPDNGGVCQTCGGDLVGDGYSTVRHCENLDVIGEGYEPDAGPLHCQEPTNG